MVWVSMGMMLHLDRVTLLQRAIKINFVYMYQRPKFFFCFFFCLRTSSGVDSVCRPNSNVDRTYCPVQLSARQAAG